MNVEASTDSATLERTASRLVATDPNKTTRARVDTIERLRATNKALERRLAETQAQLFESIEEKQRIIDQEKTRTLRELRRYRVESERIALAETLQRGGVPERGDVPASQNAPLPLHRMQVELARLQRQMESARSLVADNSRLSGRCEQLENELEAARMKLAGKRGRRVDGQSLLSVRHSTTEANVLIQNDLYVYDVSGDGGTSSLSVGDRILEINGMKVSELASSHIQHIFDSSREVLVKISRPTRAGAAAPPTSLREPLPMNRVASLPYNPLQLTEPKARVFSIDGLIGTKGGILHMPQTGATLMVTNGAFASPCRVYVTARYNSNPNFDLSPDEFVAGPEVTCIAEQQRFEKPAELKVPHCIATEAESWSLRIFRGVANTDGTIAWTELARLGNSGVRFESECRLGHDHVNVPVDNLSSYVVVGRPIRMQIAAFGRAVNANDWSMRVRIAPELRSTIQAAAAAERGLDATAAGYKPLLTNQTFSLRKTRQDISVTLQSKAETWHVHNPVTKVISWADIERLDGSFPPLEFNLSCASTPLPRLSARLLLQQGNHTLARVKIIKMAIIENTSEDVVESKPDKGRRLSVPSILSLSVISQLATYLDSNNGWRPLAKALRLDRRLIEDIGSTSEYRSATERVLSAWKPAAGTDVRTVLWKFLTELGRSAAASVVIPPEELAVIRQMEGESSPADRVSSSPPPSGSGVSNGSGYAALAPVAVAAAAAPASGESDNDSTEVNFDGKSELSGGERATNGVKATTQTETYL